MRLRVYSILFFLVLCNAAFGQHSLSGVVKDESSGKPIADAQIYLKELNLLKTTDAKGMFVFPDLDEGNYELIIFSFDYEKVVEQIDLSADRHIDITLKLLLTELSEVVISQRKEEVFGLKRLQPVEGTAIYAGKKTEVILVDQLVGNMAANNARQVFSQVVGLNIYDTNDAGLQLSIGGRGLDPNRTSNFNTRQNGYDISADVLGYPESYYTPPVESLGEIEVIRGAASLQYGTQFGGLVNFKMREPAEDKKIELVSRQTLGSFGLFTTFNSLSGTLGKFSYYTYFNYKKGDGYRPNSEFESINYFGDFRWAVSDQTKLSFEYTHLNYLAQQPGGMTDGQFESDPLFSNRERNWFQVDWNLYALKWKQSISNRTDLSLNLFGLNASRDALGYRGIPGPDGQNRSPVREPDWQDENGEYIYTRDLIKGDFANWGAEGRFLTRYLVKNRDAVFLVGSKFYKARNTSLQGPGAPGTEADFSFDPVSDPIYPYVSDFVFPNLNWSIFGENIFFLSDKFSITPGFRFEYIKTETDGMYRYFPDPTDETTFVDSTDVRSLPRTFVLFGTGFSGDLTPSLELYGNISQNYRSVTFSDIRTVNPSFIIDPNIQDEKGYTADIGLRGRWNEYLSYDIGVYALSYEDRIGIIFDDRANRVRTNIGDAIILGFEAFYEWNLIPTFGWNSDIFRFKWFANTAFTYSQYLNSIEGNNNVDGNEVEFIPRVNVKSGINLGFKNLLLSSQITYLSQQYTDAENSPVAEEGDARAGIIGEIPGYHVVDVSMSYSYKFLRLEAGSNNVTNNNYFTRRATGYPGPGIIPSDGRSFYFTLEVKF